MDLADGIGKADLRGKAPRIVIYVAYSGDTISRASFLAFGCGVAIAACSKLTEVITGQSRHFCSNLCAADLCNALDGVPSDRTFCIELAIIAMHRAINTSQIPTAIGHGGG
jgi:NifU-like protein involved in Fe-S cluster formation